MMLCVWPGAIVRNPILSCHVGVVEGLSLHPQHALISFSRNFSAETCHDHRAIHERLVANESFCLCKCPHFPKYCRAMAVLLYTKHLFLKLLNPHAELRCWRTTSGGPLTFYRISKSTFWTDYCSGKTHSNSVPCSLQLQIPVL